MNAISSACPCLSPQEERLQEKIQGKENHFRKTHPRVFRLLERFDGQKPRIDIERALYFTESMRQTEGEHLTLRWAKALMHIAKNIASSQTVKNVITNLVKQPMWRFASSAETTPKP